MNETWKNRLQQLADLPFLAVFTFYLIHLLFESSTFFLPLPGGFLRNLLILLCLSLLPRIPVYLKALKSQKKLLAAAILLAANYALIYHSGGHFSLLYTGVLTIGFLEMDHRKVMKLFTIVLGCFLVLVFTAACCGAIQDLVMMKDGYIRTSLGICYPTDMASYVLFLLMYSWAAWKRIPDLVTFVLGIVCFFFSRYIAMSITSTICSVVFCTIVLGHFLCIECGLARRVPVCLKTLVRQLMTFAFPLLALLMFALIYAYSKNIGPALRLNGILSNRLELPLAAFHQYGLKPFGTPFEQIGNGFTTFAPNNYNFVDSTYPLILLRYGWVLFLALCVSWTAATRNAFLKRDSRLACLMAMIAFHSFSEHHFIAVNFNILLVLPFAAFIKLPAVEKHPLREEVLRSGKVLLGLAAMTGLSACILPAFFTWMRTIFQLNQWTGGGKNVYPAIRVLFYLYGSAVLAAAGILFSISVLRHRKTKAPKKKAAAGIMVSAASLAVLFSLVQAGNSYINRSVSDYSKWLKEDQKALQLITEAASGKVYIDSVPRIYQQKYPGISDTMFLGDELARFYSTSVIMDIKYDSNCFINSGFLFTPISSRHALYTNDTSVIDALKEQGYHLTGYYNTEKSVNLRYLARLNQIPYTNKTGLSLSGSKYALLHGPHISLYGGPYTATFKLKLTEFNNLLTENEMFDSVATLRVSAYNGEKVLKEHVLNRDQFDENGQAVIQLPFTSSNYSGIEFLVIPGGDYRFTVSSISYCRTPQYDIHNLYNTKKRKYRMEFYTLEGAPTTTTEGYSACEYEYNYNGIITEVRYYDAKNQPTLINNGYASLQRALDQRGRTTLESYFDIDKKPTLCSEGYASVSREYDQDNNVTIEKYFDTTGNPTGTTFIYSEIHREYNDRNQVIKESYYDSDGQPLTMPAGYSMIESQYDSSGRPYIQKYLDINGNPVITASHYAEIHREYTPQNWVSKESYYDTKGLPLTLPAGYSMIKRSFDDKGNAILTEYCDSKGVRVMTTMHYAALMRRYNERNHVIYDAYLGINNEALLMPEKYAAISYERNEVGDAIVFKYYNQLGQLTLRSEGYAQIMRSYNEQRLPYRDIYLDVNGNPIITKMMYAEIRRDFNSLRQISKEYYFDTNGEPMVLPSGQASVSYERDSTGLPLIFRYYDSNNHPVLLSNGYAEMHRGYNNTQQIISESYYDANHNPVNNTSNFHRVEYERDNNNRVIRYRYYDINLNPCLGNWGYFDHQITYDSSGNIVSQNYYDTEGKELLPPQK